MRCCTNKVIAISGSVVAFFGLSLVAIAMFLPPYIDNRLENGIISQTVLTPESQTNNDDVYKTFTDNSQGDAIIPMYKAYFMNITNPQAVLNGSKPILQEIGPYTFSEHKIRFDVEFDRDIEDHRFVSYRTYKYYIFDPSQSTMNDMQLSLKDNITTINMVFQVASSSAPSYLDPILKFVCEKKQFDCLFVTKTVYELLFGYDKIGNSSIFPGFAPNATSRDNAPTTRNAVYTGEDSDMKLLRSYYKYWGNDYVFCKGVPAWETSAAGRIFGTDGTIFHRHVKTDEVLSAFVSDLYREVGVSYVQTVTYKGITLYRFQILSSLLQNETSNPYNEAYYGKGYNGLLNISKCEGGPVFVSKPHFLDADRILFESVEGLVDPKTRPDDYDTYLDLEPITGFVMYAKKRLQVNTLIQPLWNTLFTNVTRTYIPIVWFEESGSIGDSQAHDFVTTVYGAQNLSKYIKWVGFIGGEVFILTGVVLILIGWSRTKEVPYETENINTSLIKPLD